MAKPENNSEAYTHIGTTTDGVSSLAIPDNYFEKHKNITMWLYLHDEPTDSETRFVIEIPVRYRAKPVDGEPAPAEESAISEAITALNNAVIQTAADVEAIAGVEEAVTTAKEATQQAQRDADNARDEAVRKAGEVAEAETRISGYADTATEKAREAAASASVATNKATEASNVVRDAQAELVNVQSLVLVQTQQPTSEANKLWIKERAEEEYTFPTQAEFETLERSAVKSNGATMSGDLSFNTGNSVVINSPNGTSYKISVADDGTLSATAVTT